VIVNSVMFKFISYWRVAAVVLCDLASTAYYIGGIVESSIGACAPWFILAVMIFSYAVRNVYIESCSLFVRGGVYRIVKEAMGGFLAKLAVSALMFDYILTGPISGVSAGQYIIGLGLAVAKYVGHPVNSAAADSLQSWGSVIIACLITLYFFRQNLLGIHESSGKALKIMFATTVMAAIILVWCGITLVVDGPRNHVPFLPDLTVKNDPTTGKPIDPLGFLGETKIAQDLHALKGAPATNWLSVVGVFGILVAFGHSILAMSGEETLAQVYREVESPKLKNFRRAALIVFIYSLVLTAGISFLAVLLVPDNVRMSEYSNNLIGGLAMSVVGPELARILLNAFVVAVGFLILAGAVNTAIIGSNGVLNRVAEDGVMPDWFLKPHSKFGTTYRVLGMILLLQLFTIIASRGDTIVLGEAYAFGVVWSFVFQSLAMVVLRFRDRRPREFKVPLNIAIGKLEIPIGLLLVFLVLISAAVTNLFTKDVATRWGIGFTAAFMVVFTTSEQYYVRRRRGSKHEHREQFNRDMTPEISLESLHINKKPYRKLVAIRSPNNLFMLQKALAESDPATTYVIVMTAKLDPTGALEQPDHELDTYDQRLMTAVVALAEKSGKEVVPLIVPTNNPLFAVVRTAHDLEVQELIVGVSNKNTADEQLDQIALYWFNVCGGNPPSITVRIVSRDREVHLDLAGGNRIPKISERQARSVAELRAAGVGVSRVLLVHDGTSGSHDLFQSVLTMLDPAVSLDLAIAPADALTPGEVQNTIAAEQARAKQLGRELAVHPIQGNRGADIVRTAREGRYDLTVVSMPEQWADAQNRRSGEWISYVLDHAHCPVFLAAPPAIPMEVDENESASSTPTRPGH
jgi:nucleotide-binding universal stress UspA family protein